MWVQATWHSSPGQSAPATQRPARIPSRTIYGLTAYLCQIAERISSDPFDPPPGCRTIAGPETRSRPPSRPWGILPQPPRYVLGLEWEWVAVVERSDTTGEPLKGHRPMFLVHSAPATRRLAGRVRGLLWSATTPQESRGHVQGPGFLGHTTPFTRPPQASELALQKPLAQRPSRRYDHQR